MEEPTKSGSGMSAVAIVAIVIIVALVALVVVKQLSKPASSPSPTPGIQINY